MRAVPDRTIDRIPRHWLALAVLALVAGAGGLSWPAPDSAATLREADAALRAGDLDRAQTLLERLDQLQPRPAFVDWLAADLAEARGEPDLAIASLGRIGPEQRLAVRAKVRAASIELARNQGARAERILAEAVTFDPADADARRLRATLYLRHARARALADELRELSSIEPLSPDACRAWARAHLGLAPAGGPERRINNLLPLTHANPSDIRASLALAELLRRIGRLDDAREVLLDFHDHVPDVRATRAEIELDAGNLQNAATILRGGPEEHPGINRLRGRLALVRSDPAAALNALDLAEAFEPGRLDVARDRVDALQRLGRDTTDANLLLARRLALAEALEQPATSIEHLASLAEEAGADHLARAGYDAALAAMPGDPDLIAILQRLDARLAGVTLALADPSAHARPLRPAAARR